MKLKLGSLTRRSIQSLKMILVKLYFMPQNLICRRLLYGSLRSVEDFIHLCLDISLIDRNTEVVWNFLDAATSCWCCWRFVGLQEAQTEDQCAHYGFESRSRNSLNPKGERNHARCPHATSWRNVFLELVEKIASAMKTL